MFDIHPWLSATIEFDALSAGAFDAHALRLKQIGADFGTGDKLSFWAQNLSPGEKNRSLLGITVAGRIRASALIRVAVGRRSLTAHAMIGVEKDWRRQGMGTGLLHQSIDLARSAGASQIVVHDMVEAHSMLWMQQLEFDLIFRREACEAWLDLKYATQNASFASPFV